MCTRQGRRRGESAEMGTCTGTREGGRREGRQGRGLRERPAFGDAGGRQEEEKKQSEKEGREDIKARQAKSGSLGELQQRRAGRLRGIEFGAYVRGEGGGRETAARQRGAGAQERGDQGEDEQKASGGSGGKRKDAETRWSYRGRACMHSVCWFCALV